VRAHREPGTVSLLIAILEDRPSLPGAACIGNSQAFDRALHPEPGDRQAITHSAAAGICARCPHRTQCPDTLTGINQRTRFPDAIDGDQLPNDAE
jgi:hypothetical protein